MGTRKGCWDVTPHVWFQKAQGLLQKRQEGVGLGWESWGLCGGRVVGRQPWSVLRAARSREGRGRACQEMVWAGWGLHPRVPALEASWRRDLIGQMVLGCEVFWERRRSSVHGHRVWGLIL